MPLTPGSSRETISKNISELHTGKTYSHTAAKFGKEDANKQAIAIALNTARKVRRARGGGINGIPHQGPIMSMVGGRTDHHPMKVQAGSYVLPADHVSSLGQGNTQSGMAVLNHMFKSGPYGTKSLKIAHGPRLRAAGGVNDGGTDEEVPIYAAGGEYVIPPEKVAEIGGGNIKAGHAILDAWVNENRKKHIKTLRKLPPPAKK
jgi:hypothetical protein